jgi:hypothetical protein
MTEPTKHAIDFFAALTAFAAYMKLLGDILAPIAALLAIGWYGYRYYKAYKGEQHGD